MQRNTATSYNYNDITEGLRNSKESPSQSLEKDKLNNLKPPSVTLRKSTGSSRQLSRVLVNDAVELHKTKSYVVNLIDQALSSHLSTMVTDKYTNKEVLFIGLNCLNFCF